MKKYKTIDLLHAAHNGKEFKRRLKNIVSGQVIQQGLKIEDSVDQSKHFFIDNKINFYPNTTNLKTIENWLRAEWEEVQEPVTFMEAINSGKKIKPYVWTNYYTVEGIIEALQNRDLKSLLILINGEWLIEEDI